MCTQLPGVMNDAFVGAHEDHVFVCI